MTEGSERHPTNIPAKITSPHYGPPHFLAQKTLSILCGGYGASILLSSGKNHCKASLLSSTMTLRHLTFHRDKMHDNNNNIDASVGERASVKILPVYAPRGLNSISPHILPLMQVLSSVATQRMCTWMIEVLLLVDEVLHMTKIFYETTVGALTDISLPPLQHQNAHHSVYQLLYRCVGC